MNVLYPNPYKGNAPALLYLSLTSPASVQVQIFTIAFRKIYDQTLNPIMPGQNLTLPLKGADGNAFSNGIYYVVVTVNGNRQFMKWLILR
jgi:hypothetical protein